MLQTLQWTYPAERWLLKAPMHLEAIRVLLQTYPDACVVHTHRDPAKAVPSAASLAGVFRGICSRSIDRHQLGAQVLDGTASLMTRYLADRPQCDASRFLDLHYADLTADPMQAVRDIYRRFDLTLSPEATARMEAFLQHDAKTRRANPAHRYTPENFGLTAEGIRQRLRSYSETFDC